MNDKVIIKRGTLVRHKTIADQTMTVIENVYSEDTVEIKCCYYNTQTGLFETYIFYIEELDFLKDE